MAITITTPPQNNITVNETTQTVNVTNSTNTISVQTSGIATSPSATTFSALTDVSLTTPSQGQLISYDTASGLWKNNKVIVSGTNPDNRIEFQYNASNAGSNSAIVLRKNYGATNFAVNDGIGIRFEVDSDQQPATEFAILHAQYGATNPAFVFATSINDGTSYQNALLVRPDKTTVYGDLQVNGNTISSSTLPAIEMTGADVKTYGNLIVGGNNIKTADGTTAITLTDVNGNVTFLGNVTYGGDLTVGGDTISSSTLPAIQLDGANVATLGNLSVGTNVIKTANNTTAITMTDTTGAVTLANNLNVTGEITAGSGIINGVRLGITELDGKAVAVISADESPAYDLIIQGGSTLRLQNDFIRFEKDYTGGTNSGIANAYFNTSAGRYSFNTTQDNPTYNLYVDGTFKSTGDATVNDLKLLGDTIYSSTGYRMFDYREYSTIYGTSYQVKMNLDKTIGLAASYMFLDNIVEHNTSSMTTTSNSTYAVLDYFDKTVVRSAKYVIQITNGSNHQMWEGMMIHDGTNIVITGYGDVRTNGVNLAEISAGFNATTGHPELRVTPIFATQTKFKAAKTLIYV